MPDPIARAGLDTGKLFAGIADLPAIGLAVSGGPDSLALMLLVRAWKDGRGTKQPAVHVYSVDHGLRTEAADEARFVQELAEKLGFAGKVLRWDGDKPASGVQAAARAARYNLMRSAMLEDGVPVLITAHHAEDQAETVLMRMAHGSGVTGLAGMSAWSDIDGVKLHRPLLAVSRQTLHDLVAEAGITAFTDPSNLDTKYERTRWRAALPALDELGLGTAEINRLARRLARTEAALAATADDAQGRLVTTDDFGVVSAPLDRFLRLQSEIAIRILTRMLGLVNPHGTRRLEQIEDLLEQIRTDEFPGVVLSGCQIRKHNDFLVVFREVGRLTAEPQIVAAGDVSDWDGRFEVHNLGDEPVVVSAAAALNRDQAEAFVGHPIAAPMMAVHAAPLVRNLRQEIVALGTISAAKTVEITQDVAAVGGA